MNTNFETTKQYNQQINQIQIIIKDVNRYLNYNKTYLPKSIIYTDKHTLYINIGFVHG